MNEVFRFMVLRPAKAIDIEDSKYVRIANPKSELQNQLHKARKDENAFTETATITNNFINSEEFIVDPARHIPWKEFINQVDQQKPVDVDKLDDVIKQVFNYDAKTMATDDHFIKAKRCIGDSILALVITHQESSKNYEDLVQAFRVCRLLERIAVRDLSLNKGDAVEDALNQIILLPENIFPLPEPKYANEFQSKRQEEYQKIKAEKEKRIQGEMQRLARLKTALDEISSIRSSDFKSIEDQLPMAYQEVEQEEEGELKKVANVEYPRRDAWILKESVTDQLSDNTKIEIRDLGFSLETTPLPEITRILEKRLLEVGSEVFKPEPPREVIRIGSVFIPVSAILSEDTTGQ